MNSELSGWKGKYPVSWCHECNTVSISHVDCPKYGSSCNGAGCESCRDDFEEFNKLQIKVEDYLTPAEAEVWQKGLRIRHHIVEGLQRGETKLDWNKLAEQGRLSDNERKMFGIKPGEHPFLHSR